jgi:hypothetical protein
VAENDPEWEKTPTPPTGVSRFIKPKRKVAALLGGKS